MKFIISLLLIALLSFAAGLYFPWWSIAIVAFVVSALIPLRPGKAFLCGFIALFLLWGGLSFYLSSNNDHLLAHKMAGVIFKSESAGLLLLATAVIGALIGGLGALAGSLLRGTAVKTSANI